MLLCQSYFDKCIKPVVHLSSDEIGKAHSLFKLPTANDGQLPISMYMEMDVNFLGLKVQNMGFLVTKDPNGILSDHQPKFLE